MSKPIHPTALFRLTVLGPLASRGEIKRGEVKRIIRQLATESYKIPDSNRTYLSEETIARWHSLWKRGGIDALNPQVRADRGTTQLPLAVQSKLIELKQDAPERSINQLIEMIERAGLVSKASLSRATVHRFLQQQKLSKRILPDQHSIERRSFVAAHAGDLWQGDALHGPCIQTPDGMKKTYLVSLMDDASRLIAHAAFCFGETALDIEGILKQAILKRGLPHKLLIDNGPAYISGSLKSICARLEIRLVYCRPYEPEGKGKLERFHRTFREQFLNEIDPNKICSLGDLNARLWAWVEQVYHQRRHGGLEDDKSPLDRWREDLHQVRPLAAHQVHRIDDLFYHRVDRLVRKNGTISWNGNFYEVHHNHVGEKVTLVFDPHTSKAVRIENVIGDDLGAVVPLDLNTNLHRARQRPHAAPTSTTVQREHAVELVHQDYVELWQLPTTGIAHEGEA
jgi:transposase InsO family protein